MIRILLGIAVALFVALMVLGYYTKNLHADYITEKGNNVVLEAAKLELEEKVEKANEVSKKYQTKLNGVDGQLRALRLRYKSSDCVNVNTTKRGSSGAGTGKVISNGNGGGGLSPDWLLDFAARCEKTKQKTIGLQEFSKGNR